jgi:hypothetical protein
MENKNWGIGAKLWFGLMILCQWIMFIGGINVLSLLIQGNVSGGLLAAIIPVVTFLLARRQVGFEPL